MSLYLFMIVAIESLPTHTHPLNARYEEWELITPNTAGLLEHDDFR